MRLHKVSGANPSEMVQVSFHLKIVWFWTCTYTVYHAHKHTNTHHILFLPIFRIAINLSIHLSDVFINIFFQTPSTTPKRKKEGIIHCMKYNHSLYMPVTLVHDITTYLWLTSQFSNREVVNATSFPMVGLIGPAKCTPRLRLAQSPRRTSWPESMAKERNSKIQVDTGFPMNFFTSQNSDGMVEWMDSFWDRASSSSPSGDQKYPCFFSKGRSGGWTKLGARWHGERMCTFEYTRIWMNMRIYSIQLPIPTSEASHPFAMLLVEITTFLKCHESSSWQIITHAFLREPTNKNMSALVAKSFLFSSTAKRRMVWLYSQCLNGSISLRRAQLPLWQEGTEICVDWCRPLYVTWT